MIRIEMEKESVEKKMLEDAISRHPKAYIRERASAVLQVCSGASGRSVAQEGLLQKRRSNTVYEWLHRYNELGLLGLYNRPGRGRKRLYDQSEEAQIRKKVHLIVLHERGDASTYPN